MLRHIRARDRGQVLVIAAVLLPVLLAMTGMAIDIGRYSSDRRSLQNVADSVALAASQELCNTSCTDYDDAIAAGNAILDQYDIDGVSASIVGSGGNSAPKITVEVTRTHDFVFMRIVGINDKSVSARAAAVKVSYGGGSGVVPWAVTDDIAGSAGSGELVTMKYDANNVQNGNFGPIRIDIGNGAGSSDYEDGVSYGSDSYICAESTPNCSVSACGSGSFPGGCAEDAEGCVGPDCGAKPGNMVGATQDGVDFRVDNTSASCDEFDEVFTADTAFSRELFERGLRQAYAEQSTGGRLSAPAPHHGGGSHPTYTPVPPTSTHTPAPTSTPAPTDTPAPPTSTPVPATVTPTSGDGSDELYHLNPECNPWIDGPGKCPDDNPGTLCSRRVIIIPIIDSFGNGSEDVTVIRFALMFLEGYQPGDCTGSDCEIQGRFVRAEVTTGALSGVYDPEAPIQFTRLSE
jgi:Flp pilus assembly protein TadG